MFKHFGPQISTVCGGVLELWALRTCAQQKKKSLKDKKGKFIWTLFGRELNFNRDNLWHLRPLFSARASSARHARLPTSRRVGKYRDVWETDIKDFGNKSQKVTPMLKLTFCLESLKVQKSREFVCSLTQKVWNLSLLFGFHFSFPFTSGMNFCVCVEWKTFFAAKCKK